MSIPVGLLTSLVYPGNAATTFRLAGELGYDGVEVIVCRLPPLMKQLMKQLVKRLVKNISDQLGSYLAGCLLASIAQQRCHAST